MADHEITLRLDFRPAEVSANFDEMSANLAKFMEPYEGMDAGVIADMPIADVKTARASLNKVINSVEDGRRKVKAEYNKPLAAFESQVKALLKPARDMESMLKDAVDEHAGRERAENWRLLDDFYRETAPLLADVVPLETILPDRKWQSKSNHKAARGEIVRVAGDLAKDWDTLKHERDSLFDYAECERDLFATLDLRGVRERDEFRRAQSERLSGMKQDIAYGEAEHVYRFTAVLTPSRKDELIRILKASGFTQDAGVRITFSDLGEVEDGRA